MLAVATTTAGRFHVEEQTLALVRILDAIRLEIRAASLEAAGYTQSAAELRHEAHASAVDAITTASAMVEREELQR